MSAIVDASCATKLDVAVDPVGAFIPSSPSEDPRILRERLDRDGYLFVRGLITPERIRRVRAAILGLCADHGWLAPGSDPDLAVIRPGLEFNEWAPAAESEFLRVYRRMINLALFNGLPMVSPTMSFFERLLGGDILVHNRKILRVVLPGGPTTQPHQDWRYIGGTPDTFTTWVPLGGCPRRLGGLAILEGSHRLGRLTHQPAIGPGGLGVQTAALGLRWLHSDYEPGDVMLFTSHTVHASLPMSDSGHIRLSADFRYQRADEAIDDESLLPQVYEGSNR